MNIRITNLTGRNLYYQVLDYEGPYAKFSEDSLPGMYPNGQDTYTDSNVYTANNSTKVGNQRYTLSSRYPRFNSPQDYMMNFNTGQKPSHRSYKDVSHNYPEQTLNGRNLDGNREGIIPIGLHRDLMLSDGNCNLYLRTTGKPIRKPIVSTAKYDYQGGSSELFEHNGLGQHSAHDLQTYEATIKAARLRENHVLAVIQFDNQYHMYDETGNEVKVDYPQDTTAIPLIAQSVINPQRYSAGRYSYGNERFQRTRSIINSAVNPKYSFRNLYPYASVDTEPAINGTYIDSLQNEANSRKKAYSRKYVDMTNSNYSDDYDSPLLGYFDRRFLYRQPPGYLHQ